MLVDEDAAAFALLGFKRLGKTSTWRVVHSQDLRVIVWRHTARTGLTNAYGLGDFGKMNEAVALAMSSGGYYGDGSNFKGNLVYAIAIEDVRCFTCLHTRALTRATPHASTTSDSPTMQPTGRLDDREPTP